jgi:hypothetical protein
MKEATTSVETSVKKARRFLTCSTPFDLNVRYSPNADIRRWRESYVRYGSSHIPTVGSKPTHEKQHDEDDQDDADDTYATVTEAVAVTAEAATEATKQKNDEDDNEDESQ